MRIDSHQHFWRFDRDEYGWITEEMRTLQRDYLPQDLEPLLERMRFDGCLAVQARQTLEETSWLLELAASSDFIKGVVGWADLCSLDLAAQLATFKRQPKLVGVRHVLQGEADDAFMLREDFRRGIAQLGKHGLVYELLVMPRHLRNAALLVAEFPEQQFVIDHIAKPFIAEQLMSPWDDELRELSTFPNVSCKLSGMVTEARWGEWKETDFIPYLEHVVGSFGPDRVMIGSDWPVCLVSATYAQTMEIVMNFIAGLSADSQAAVLGENCCRIYGLPRQGN